MVPTRSSWSKVLVMILVVSVSCLIFAPVGLADTTGAESGTPSGAGLQAASWLITLPYGAAKVGMALVGGVVGGLTYVFSGGNTEAAKKVWKPTMYGTYVITPEHLKGQKPVRFIGTDDHANA